MKGIIYKIVDNETNEAYYGSTQRSLNRRITEHKLNCKYWKEGKYHYVTSFNIIERGNYSYSLIETIECGDKQQFYARERFYIENNECINKVVPNRSKKEWDLDNKDHVKEYKQKDKERSNELQRIRRAKRKQLEENK